MSLDIKIFYVLLRKTPSSCVLSVLSLVRALQSDCISTLLNSSWVGFGSSCLCAWV